MELAFSVEKKTKWRTSHPEGARFLANPPPPPPPPPLQWEPTFTGRGRVTDLVWRTDLELDLELTQNYRTELFALYLRRTII